LVFDDHQGLIDNKLKGMEDAEGLFVPALRDASVAEAIACAAALDTAPQHPTARAV
jgi:hypothetical protein